MNKQIGSGRGGKFDLESFTSGISKASLLWNYYGEQIEMEFLAGFVGTAQNTQTMQLRPEIGWCVREKSAEPVKRVVQQGAQLETSRAIEMAWASDGCEF